MTGGWLPTSAGCFSDYRRHVLLVRRRRQDLRTLQRVKSQRSLAVHWRRSDTVTVRAPLTSDEVSWPSVEPHRASTHSACLRVGRHTYPLLLQRLSPALPWRQATWGEEWRSGLTPWSFSRWWLRPLDTGSQRRSRRKASGTKTRTRP